MHKPALKDGVGLSSANRFGRRWPGELIVALAPQGKSDGQVLEAPNLPIEHAYFIEHGLAFIIAIGSKNRRLEVGLIGRDGMTGIAISLAATVRQTRLSSKLPEAACVSRVMICRLPCMIRKSGNRFSERIMRQKRA